MLHQTFYLQSPLQWWHHDLVMQTSHILYFMYFTVCYFVATSIHPVLLTCINGCSVVYVLQATVQRLIKCIQFFFFFTCCVTQKRQAIQLDTHQVLFRLSIQYQATLLGYGNSPSLTVKLLPPYSPVSLKSASPTQAECVGELLFICFNI